MRPSGSGMSFINDFSPAIKTEKSPLSLAVGNDATAESQTSSYSLYGVTRYGETRLNEGEFYMLDAPGINGSGSDSLERMKKYIEAGGRVLHKMALDKNGVPQLVDPKAIQGN
jgi:hypothetical protein